MPLRPRPEIEKLAPAAHGGPDEAEFRRRGLSGAGIIDFSVCSNPYMKPPDADELLKGGGIDRLPDSAATELREALSGKLGVSAENIIVGNGAMEPIRLAVLAYFGPGDKVVIPEPTFGEYRVACGISGAEAICRRAAEQDNFMQDAAGLARTIKTERPKGVFLCNPNNPTGQYLARRQVTDMLDASEETLLVLDEAYVSFVEDGWSSLDLTERPNLIIVRSMTKDFALAGLRLGYAVAHRSIIETLRRVQPPWSVNVLAQRAGVLTVADFDAVADVRNKILSARRYLADSFTKMGFGVLPSATHFFLMKVENPPEFRSALLERGLLVRDCASFGLPGYVRIAARTEPECRRLIEAVKELKLR